MGLLTKIFNERKAVRKQQDKEKIFLFVYKHRILYEEITLYIISYWRYKLNKTRNKVLLTYADFIVKWHVGASHKDVLLRKLK